jgi:trehalose 6-phosphate synthase/phosphatase
VARDGERLLQALDDARERGPVQLFLDYDGTLVDFAPRPELATPDKELMATLRDLASADDVTVHIVSGRPRDFLEKWFGSLPIGLHGEHGLVSRPPGATTWTTAPAGSQDWQARVFNVLRRFSSQIPGSLVETKARSIAFHYRQVNPEHAASVVKEIRLHLTEMLSQFGAQVISGNRVLEVRPMGIDKGNIVTRVMATADHGATAVVFGDDRTDEDMFAAAPDGSITVHVGNERTQAVFRIADCRETRAVLKTILGHARAHG